MKKGSKSLSLVLMGTLTVAVGGCGSDEPTEDFRAYRSIDECVNDQVFSQSECREMAIAAVQQNPQFANQAECEKEFGEGNCKQPENVQNDRQGGGSSWMPLLAGFMAGRYLGGGSMMQGSQPLYQQPQAQQQQGATARASGGFRTLGGASIQTDAKGKVANPPQAARQGFSKTAKPYVSRTGSGSRGGFSGGSSGS